MTAKSWAALGLGAGLGLIGCGAGTSGSKADGGEKASTANVLTSVPPGQTPPDWAAFQDGTGAWTAATASAGGGYSFQVGDAQGRYAFAAHCGANLLVIEATAAELSTIALPSCATGADTTPLTSEVLSSQSWPANASAVGVYIGDLSSWQGNLFATAGETATEQVSPGKYDVLAEVMDASSSVSAAKLTRGVVVPAAGGSLVDDLGDATTLDHSTVNWPSPQASETITVGVKLVTQNAAFVLDERTGPSVQLALFPSSALVPTDKQFFYAQASTEDGKLRGVVGHASTNISFAPPSYLSSFTATVAAGSSARPLSAQWSGAPSGAGALLAGTDETSNQQLAVYQSPKVLAGATQLAFPDLTAVKGFQASWGFSAGATVAAQGMLASGRAADIWSYLITGLYSGTDSISLSASSSEVTGG